MNNTEELIKAVRDLLVLLDNDAPDSAERVYMIDKRSFTRIRAAMAEIHAYTSPVGTLLRDWIASTPPDAIVAHLHDKLTAETIAELERNLPAKP